MNIFGMVITPSLLVIELYTMGVINPVYAGFWAAANTVIVAMRVDNIEIKTSEDVIFLTLTWLIAPILLVMKDD